MSTAEHFEWDRRHSGRFGAAPWARAVAVAERLALNATMKVDVPRARRSRAQWRCRRVLLYTSCTEPHSNPWIRCAQAERITDSQLVESPRAPSRADEIGVLAELSTRCSIGIEAAAAGASGADDVSHAALRMPLTTRAPNSTLAPSAIGVREMRAARRYPLQKVGARACRLADDLLVLARADQGRLPLSQEPLMADEPLETVAARAGAAAKMRARAIVVQGEIGAESVVEAIPTGSRRCSTT